MIDMKDLVTKCIEHKAVLDQSGRDIRDNNIRIDDEQRKLDNLIKEKDLTQFSYDYLDKLVKEESGKFIKNLSDMLNYAVKTIFFDCDYSIEIRTEDNRTSIRLRYINDEGQQVDADVKDCGGGIRSVLGTLLAVFFIFKYKAEPIYLVDEGFSQISTQYLPPMFELLDELAIKNDLKVLLITHDTRLENLDTIKKLYKVENGYVKEEEVKKSNASVPDEAEG
jgi:hypothetical protein